MLSKVSLFPLTNTRFVWKITQQVLTYFPTHHSEYLNGYRYAWHMPSFKTRVFKTWFSECKPRYWPRYWNQTASPIFDLQIAFLAETSQKLWEMGISKIYWQICGYFENMFEKSSKMAIRHIVIFFRHILKTFAICEFGLWQR